MIQGLHGIKGVDMKLESYEQAEPIVTRLRTHYNLIQKLEQHVALYGPITRISFASANKSVSIKIDDSNIHEIFQDLFQLQYNSLKTELEKIK